MGHCHWSYKIFKGLPRGNLVKMKKAASLIREAGSLNQIWNLIHVLLGNYRG